MEYFQNAYENITPPVKPVNIYFAVPTLLGVLHNPIRNKLPVDMTIDQTGRVKVLF
jgi:hypothetical protein